LGDAGQSKEPPLQPGTLADVMKGMDLLGRILFTLYGHGEEFAERYGSQEMPELEDALRNAFFR
jgi:hypothetical protein